MLCRDGGVLCLEPGTSRNCPSHLAAPQKGGFLTQKATRAPLDTRKPGGAWSRTSPTTAAGMGAAPCPPCPPVGGRSPREPPSRHSHRTATLTKKKKTNLKMGLFDFKLQNSSLEPSANSGNLLYSCLDLFLYIFF